VDIGSEAIDKQSRISAEQLLVLGRDHENGGKKELAIESYKQAVQIADKTHQNDVKARAYQYLGYLHSGTFEYKTAIQYYQKARQISPDLEVEKLEVETYLRLGDNHLQTGQYKESKEYYMEAMKLFGSQFGDKESKINAYLRLGNAFSCNGERESSRKYFLKALTVAEQINHKVLQKEAYSNLGYVYYETCKYDAAVKSYLKVQEISHDLGEKKEEANACLMLSDSFQKLKEQEKAIEFSKKAVNICKELEDTEIQTRAAQGLGKLYLTLALFSSKECDYKVAIDWYEKTLEIFETELNDNVLEEKALTGLGVAWFELGNTAKAIAFIQEARKFAKKETDRGNYFIIVKVIAQFCIAHFHCAHLITYNFIHYTYRLKKNHFMTILCYFKTSMVAFVQRIMLKSMFSKKEYKSVATVGFLVSVVYLFTCISRFNATIP
jgi:tetratricopeptide (TPR) repeat protein